MFRFPWLRKKEEVNYEKEVEEHSALIRAKIAQIDREIQRLVSMSKDVPEGPKREMMKNEIMVLHKNREFYESTIDAYNVMKLSVDYQRSQKIQAGLARQLEAESRKQQQDHGDVLEASEELREFRENLKDAKEAMGFGDDVEDVKRDAIIGRYFESFGVSDLTVPLVPDADAKKKVNNKKQKQVV